MRRRTRHVQVDHALRFRRVMRIPRQHRIRRLRHRRRVLLHRVQRNRAQAELPRIAQKGAPRRELEFVVEDGVHGKFIEFYVHNFSCLPPGEEIEGIFRV